MMDDCRMIAGTFRQVGMCSSVSSCIINSSGGGGIISLYRCS